MRQLTRQSHGTCTSPNYYTSERKLIVRKKIWLNFCPNEPFSLQNIHLKISSTMAIILITLQCVEYTISRCWFLCGESVGRRCLRCLLVWMCGCGWVTLVRFLSVISVRVRMISANERRRYISNVFSHCLRPFSSRENGLGQWPK